MGMRLMLGGVGRRSEGGQSASNNGNGGQSNENMNSNNMNGGNYPQNGGQHWGNPGPGMVNAYGPQQNNGMPGHQMNGGMGALNMSMVSQGYPMENRGMGFTAPMEDYMPGGERGVMPRSEEYLPDLGNVEARRHRSRRTGRFIAVKARKDQKCTTARFIRDRMMTMMSAVPTATAMAVRMEALWAS